MKKFEIKARIEEKGSSLAAIAGGAGLHASACSQALRYPVPAANAAIAKFLGKSVHDIWPQWFDRDGNRRRDVRASRDETASKSSLKMSKA